MINPLSLVPSWVWAAAVAALAATSCKLTVDLGKVKLELTKTELAYAKERNEKLAALNTAEVNARKAEQDLANKTAAIQEQSNAKVTAANAVADGLRSRLRHAAANAATAALVPRTYPVAPIAEGGPEPVVVGLSERDGNDLVSLAARAERLRIGLQSCYAQYDAARSEIEALNRP